MNSENKKASIISAKELLELKEKSSQLIIVDVSNDKNARAQYENQHLENSIFVDLNIDLADIKTDYSEGGRHPLPEINVFIDFLQNIGITEDAHVVIYDHKNGANAAARFWWMLKSVGLDKVQVLDGGFQAAERFGYPISKGIVQAKKAEKRLLTKEWILPTVSINNIENASKSSEYLIVDVREASRFRGEQEPIDLVAGHITNSVNIPFTENLDENGFFLEPQILHNKFQEQLKSFPAENIIFHCGSGVTACHSLLALAHAGIEIPNLYVGSWSEWSRSGKEIAREV